MKRNPCRHCDSSFNNKGRHMPSYSKECLNCEKLKRHREYLKSVRKFEEGDVITSLQELLECTWVMWGGSTKHIEVFKSMPLRAVLQLIKCGAIKKAVEKKQR